MYKAHGIKKPGTVKFPAHVYVKATNIKETDIFNLSELSDLLNQELFF